jgi:hypothetical protein
MHTFTTPLAALGLGGTVTATLETTEAMLLASLLAADAETHTESGRKAVEDNKPALAATHFACAALRLEMAAKFWRAAGCAAPREAGCEALAVGCEQRAAARRSEAEKASHGSASPAW